MAHSATAPPTTEQERTKLAKRAAVASLVGTAVEWYDYFIFGTAAALVFGELFFPNEDDPIIGTLSAFAVFGVGFFARPVGGVVFGHFGDKFGRKAALVTTLMLMGVSTFLIGLLPTTDQIGIWAPILLVLLRLIQGFGVGGEWEAPHWSPSSTPRHTNAAPTAASRRSATRSGSCSPRASSRSCPRCPTTR